jgi:predicted AAA+ superfamily ATPase
MKRSLLKNLIDWRNDPEHMPLLIRGARQVGKTFLVEHFGEHFFKNKVSINFEFKPEYKACFTSMDPEIIVNRLSLLSHQPIQARETLLFLDEIQECPEALQSFRYFKEKMPSLHVIAAGSLLEFLLNREDFRMPVGRIQSLYLKPLSFYEYLDAMDRSQWREHCQSIDLKTEMDPALHQTLLDCVKDYLVLGGMPAVIHRYAKEKNYLRCQELQAGILDTYRNDFGK